MNSPRIATITAFPLRIPFDHWSAPPMFAGRPRTTLDTVLVRVTTDQGTVGWGEAYGSFWSAVVPAIEQWIAPLAVGQSVDDVQLPARHSGSTPCLLLPAYRSRMLAKTAPLTL